MSPLNLHANMLVGDAKLMKLLGTGESGEVWSALTSDGTIVALKIYRGKEEVKAKAEHEYEMARFFCNDHIISPLALSSFDSHPIIILPYCEGRSVDGIAAHLGEGMIWKLIQDISSALSEIHGKGYAHLDIKPSNILWDGKKFMLSDFGACTRPGDITQEDTATDASSYRFDAPELGKQPCSASDIWSLGATIFYLYMGCHVFNGLGGRAQHKDSPLPYMRKSMPELSLLVQKCLNMDPLQRPTSKQIVEIASAETQKIALISPERPKRRTTVNSLHTGDTEFWSDAMIEP